MAISDLLGGIFGAKEPEQPSGVSPDAGSMVGPPSDQQVAAAQAMQNMPQEQGFADKLALGLQGFSAGVAGRGQQFLQQLDEQRKDAMMKDALQVQNLLNQGDVPGAAALLSNRGENILRLGGDPSDTMGVLNKLAEGDFDGAISDVNTLVEFGYQSGRLQRQPIQSKVVGNKLVTVTPDGKATAHEISGLKKSDGTNFTWGASVTLKDENGNLFTQTQKRGDDGSIESVVVSMDGDITKKPEGQLQETGSYGLTSAEKIAQIAAERDAALAAEASRNEINTIKKNGIKARDQIPETRRMLDILDLIETGKMAEAKLAWSKWVGDDSEEAANLGLFNAKAGQAVLAQIRLLGANPTEGERSFLTDVSASLDKGGTVNRAILNDIMRIQQRQYSRGKMLAANPDLTLDDLLLMEEDEFTPSWTPEDEAATGGAPVATTTTADAVVVKGTPQYGDVYESDIQTTMRETGMTREQVLQQLQQGR